MMDHNHDEVCESYKCNNINYYKVLDEFDPYSNDIDANIYKQIFEDIQLQGEPVNENEEVNHQRLDPSLNTNSAMASSLV